MGHYNEPPLDITVKIPPKTTDESVTYTLTYNPEQHTWKVFEEIQFKFSSAPSTPSAVSSSKNEEPQNEFFAVYPRSNCPHVLDANHVSSHVKETAGSKFPGSGCHSCGDKRENWMCLTCGELFCGR